MQYQPNTWCVENNQVSLLGSELKNKVSVLVFTEPGIDSSKIAQDISNYLNSSRYLLKPH